MFLLSIKIILPEIRSGESVGLYSILSPWFKEFSATNESYSLQIYTAPLIVKEQTIALLSE